MGTHPRVICLDLKVTFKSSNLLGAGPFFPDLTFENLSVALNRGAHRPKHGLLRGLRWKSRGPAIATLEAQARSLGSPLASTPQVLAYSITEENNDGRINENPGSVLRRMYDMAEMDFNKMAGMRDRYWRPGYRRSKWVADYNMRSGRKKKEAKIRRQYETDWQEWMSTVGRQRGLTDPVLFNGPPLKLSEEDDAATDPKVFSKKIPSENELATEMKLPRGKDTGTLQSRDDGEAVTESS